MGRATASRSSTATPTTRFNPRPPHMGRATPPSRLHPRSSGCFNPRPPHMGRATQIAHAIRVLRKMFQPTPSSYGEGDRTGRNRPERQDNLKPFREPPARRAKTRLADPLQAETADDPRLSRRREPPGGPASAEVRADGA